VSVPVRLRVGGAEVAQYVTDPDVDPRHGPRPYLHPVRTAAGVPVTDVLPEDHRWHLGVSVALQDVNGTNLWGGRTYVRDQGYTWRSDHGRIVHSGWTAPVRDDGFAERLEWQDPDGGLLLTEDRTVTARPAAHGWELGFGYTLTAARDATLGSPATNGRPGGAGYGGFFWRAAPGECTTFTAAHDGEEKVNGSAEPWLALTGSAPTGPGPYTLVFRGLAGDDRWFVRTGIYPGVCAALAFTDPVRLAAGESLTRQLSVLVADGVLTRDDIAG
jgi:hypothetical protein